MPSQIKPRSLSAFLIAGMLSFCLFAPAVQAQAATANEELAANAQANHAV